MEKECKLPNFTFSSADMMGVMHVSKWQEYHIQLDSVSLQKMLSDLSLEYGYRVGQVVSETAWKYEIEKFISIYEAFLKAEEEEYSTFRKMLSLGLSIDSSAFYAKHVNAGYILTPIIPYIQVRASTYALSNEGKILPGSLGKNVVRWGLHFAYPLLCMNTKEGIAKNVLREKKYSNTPLFKSLQKWVRHFTKPADIQVGNTVVKTTMRCMR